MEEGALALWFAVPTTALATFAAVQVTERINSRTRLPPGPRPYPLVGNLLQLGDVAHQNLRKFERKYGSLMCVWLGSTPVMVVSSPHLAEQVLRKQNAIWADRGFNSVGKILAYDHSDIAFSDFGERWQEKRALFAQSVMSPKPLANFKDKLYSKIRNVISSEEFVTMTAEGSKLIGRVPILDYLPWLNSFDVGGIKKRLIAVAGKLDELYTGILEDQHRAGSEHSQTIDGASSSNVVENLRSGEVHGQALTDPENKAILQDISIGGLDGTKSTLTWAVCGLMRNPHVLRKAQAELDSVVGRDRLVDDVHGRNFDYLPFGAGRRSCAGKAMAVLEVHYSLAALLQACDLRLPDSVRLDQVDRDEILLFTLVRRKPLEVIAVPLIDQRLLDPWLEKQGLGLI